MDTRDWNLCFICQSNTQQTVRHPASSQHLCGQPQKLESSYRELVDNVIELNKLGELPSFVVLDDIIGGGFASGGGGSGDDVDRSIEMMKKNHVVWHKNCRSAVNNQKVG